MKIYLRVRFKPFLVKKKNPIILLTDTDDWLVTPR